MVCWCGRITGDSGSSRSELGDAWGAFAQSTGKVYLSQELLNSQPIEQVVTVLLEEYGHFVDSQLNAVDAPGDEGAIFSALVQGKILSVGQLSALKAENDSATFFLDENNVNVEMVASIIPVLPSVSIDDVTVTEGEVAIFPAIPNITLAVSPD